MKPYVKQAPLESALARVDCLELQLALEQTKRISAEISAIESRFALGQAELEKANQEMARIHARIKGRYRIGDEDTIDIPSGAISRKAARALPLKGKGSPDVAIAEKVEPSPEGAEPAGALPAENQARSG